VEKLDFNKTYKTYYSAKTLPSIAEFEPIDYLTIIGQGEPAGIVFTNAVEALYPLAYGVKKICKPMGADFGVPKLEGLWWVESDKPALEIPKSQWYWKLLIRMPDYVSNDIVNQAKEEVIKKKKLDLVNNIKFEKITEGKCVQIMHIGPYATEHATVELIFKYVKENGIQINGLHHEIYISDPRKTAPEKMKTIIRYPVSK